MLINKRLRQLRVQAGMTQQQTADLLDVSISTYGRYERSDISIGIDKLCMLADFYKVSMNYLLKGTYISSFDVPFGISVDFCQKYNELDVHARMFINALVDFEYQAIENRLNNDIDAQV